MLLSLLGTESGRLQSLIHQYINEPRPETFAEILLLREAVLGTLKTRGAADPMLAPAVPELTALTERFLDAFGDLRALQTAITESYENEVLAPAKQMAGLYAIIESATASKDALIGPALGKSRETFTAMLVAANAYYLSLAADAAAGSPHRHPAHRGRHSRARRPRRQRSAALRARRARSSRRWRCGTASSISASSS